MTPLNSHRLSTLALAAFTALAGMPAWAAPIPVLTATSSAATPLAGSATPSGTSSAGYVNSSSFATGADGTANGFAFASEYGAYAVSSQAQGKGSATAGASLLYTLVNNGTVAQAYSMSFHIYGGSIGTYVDSASAAALVSGESLQSGYSAKITVGGIVKFNSSATLTNDAGVLSLTKSGDALNDFGDNGSDGVYSWAGDYYNIDLGVLGAGQSIDILAEVGDSVSANVGTYDFSGGGDGYGGYGGGCSGPVNIPAATATFATDGGGTPATRCFKGRAGAFYGDPIDFNGGSSSADTGQNDGLVTFTSRDPNAVPEPATLPLTALALLGGALAARRRRS